MGLTESKNLLREKLFGFSMNASALTKNIEKKKSSYSSANSDDN